MDHEPVRTLHLRLQSCPLAWSHYLETRGNVSPQRPLSRQHCGHDQPADVLHHISHHYPAIATLQMSLVNEEPICVCCHQRMWKQVWSVCRWWWCSHAVHTQSSCQSKSKNDFARPQQPVEPSQKRFPKIWELTVISLEICIHNQGTKLNNFWLMPWEMVTVSFTVIYIKGAEFGLNLSL